METLGILVYHGGLSVAEANGLDLILALQLKQELLRLKYLDVYYQALTSRGSNAEQDSFSKFMKSIQEFTEPDYIKRAKDREFQEIAERAKRKRSGRHKNRKADL